MFGAATAVNLPVIPQDMQWVQSYETVAFATADGDLSANQYSMDEDGRTYIYRTKPKTVASVEATTSPSVTEGKAYVPLVCSRCAYYDEFFDGNHIRRVRSDRNEYDGLRYIKDFSHPRKTKLITVLSAATASAAIAYDNDTELTPAFGSSTSYLHTTSGTDRGLVLLSYTEDSGDTDRDITSASYNSVALTEGRRQNNDTMNNTTEVWYLANPTTGSNTISVTMNGNISSWYLSTVSFTGVDQTTMIDANSGGDQTDLASVSYTLTTVTNDAWIVEGATISVGTTDCSPNSGQTEFTDFTLASNAISACAGYEAIATAGAQTVSWACTGTSCNSSTDWVAAGIAICPASGCGGAPPASSPVYGIIFFDSE